MQINPSVTVTGKVTSNKFNIEESSSYDCLLLVNHTTSSLPIRAHFADSDSKKKMENRRTKGGSRNFRRFFTTSGEKALHLNL